MLLLEESTQLKDVALINVRSSSLTRIRNGDSFTLIILIIVRSDLNLYYNASC